MGCEQDKTCKTGEYFDTKNFTYKECVTDKLVWTYEDYILNTTDVTFNNSLQKKVTYKNYKYIVHTV